jgi:hypothetical protein
MSAGAEAAVTRNPVESGLGALRFGETTQRKHLAEARRKSQRAEADGGLGGTISATAHPSGITG